MKTPRSIIFGAIRLNMKTGAMWRYYDDTTGYYTGDDDNNIIRALSYEQTAVLAAMLHKTTFGGITANDISFLEEGPPADVDAGNEVIPCSFKSPLIPLSEAANQKGEINRVLIHGYFPSLTVGETTTLCTLKVYGGDGETERRSISFTSTGEHMLDLHFTPVSDYYAVLKIITPDKFMLYSPIIVNPW